MKKLSCLFVFILAVAVMLCFSVTLHADLGPKPSVHITFENMLPGIECYGTLLSKTDSTGPSAVWDGNEEYAMHSENYEWAAFDYATWKAFVEYEDPDGFYFLQEGWDVIESDGIHWTYYPPQEFKILLYFPEYNSFVSSDIYERYAFDSYFTVDMTNVNYMELSVLSSVEHDEDKSGDDRFEQWKSEIFTVTAQRESSDEHSVNMVAKKSYNYLGEGLALLVRIILTIAIELTVALCFGIFGKKRLITLATVNVITQILLNLALGISMYNMGYLAFGAVYILLEILVFAVEAVLYCGLLNRGEPKPKRGILYVAYALVANGVSFGLGLWLANVLPSVF